jgi:hypothetical protein
MGGGSELKTEGRGCVAAGDGVTRSANARLVISSTVSVRVWRRPQLLENY